MPKEVEDVDIHVKSVDFEDKSERLLETSGGLWLSGLHLCLSKELWGSSAGHGTWPGPGREGEEGGADVTAVALRASAEQAGLDPL